MPEILWQHKKITEASLLFQTDYHATVSFILLYLTRLSVVNIHRQKLDNFDHHPAIILNITFGKWMRARFVFVLFATCS